MRARAWWQAVGLQLLGLAAGALVALLTGCCETPGARHNREWEAYRAAHCHLVDDKVNPIGGRCSGWLPSVDTPAGCVFPPRVRLLECHDGKRYYEEVR